MLSVFEQELLLLEKIDDTESKFEAFCDSSSSFIDFWFSSVDSFIITIGLIFVPFEAFILVNEKSIFALDEQIKNIKNKINERKAKLKNH